MIITLSHSSLRTRPGDQVVTSVEIYNDGPTADTFSIGLEGLEQSWCRISIVSAYLHPGDSFRSLVSICPPWGSSSEAGVYALEVIVRPQSSPSVVVRKVVQLTVESLPALSAQLMPVDANRRTSNYRLTMRNDGNIELPVQLSGYDLQGCFDFQFEEEQPVIGPGGESETKLILAFKRRPLVGWPRRSSFLVKTAVPLAGAVPALLVDEATIYPYIPAWIFWAILLVMAIVAVAVGLTVVAESY